MQLIERRRTEEGDERRMEKPIEEMRRWTGVCMSGGQRAVGGAVRFPLPSQVEVVQEMVGGCTR